MQPWERDWSKPTPTAGAVDDAPQAPWERNWSAPQPPAPPRDGQMVSGFKRSFDEIPGLAAGVAAFGADLVGAEETRDALLGYAKRKSEELAQRHQGDASSITDAWDGKVGWLDFLANASGYVAGQALQAIATGGVGSLGARLLAKQSAKQLAEAAAAKAIAQGASEEAAQLAVANALAAAATTATKRGAVAGAGAHNLGMELGSIYPEAVDQAQAEGRELDAGDKFRVFAAASLAAGVDTAGEAIMASRVLGGSKAGAGAAKPLGFGGRLVREVPAGMTREAGTEAVQTMLEHYGAGQPIADEKGIRDIVDSAGIGAVGGGLGGGLAARKARPEPLPPAPPTPAPDPIGAILSAPDVESAIKAAGDAIKVPTPELELQQAGAGNGIDFEADPRFAGAPALKSGAPLPQGLVFGSKEAADIHIGETDMLGRAEAVEVAPGRWVARQTEASATASALASLEAWMERSAPMPQAKAEMLASRAKALMNKDMVVVPHIRGDFTVVPKSWVTERAIREISERRIPVGEASEVIPTGEATPLPSIPVGEASEVVPTGDATPLPRRIPVGQATELSADLVEPTAPPAPEAGMTPRRRTDGVVIDVAGPNAVAAYLKRVSESNTMAARAFMQDFNAGRITREDVMALMLPRTPDGGPSVDERLAKAAAQAPKPQQVQPGDLLTADGMPYGSKIAAQVRARKEQGVIVPVTGGWVVRKESAGEQQQPGVPSDAGVAAVAADGIGDQPVGGVATVQPVAAAGGAGDVRAALPEASRRGDEDPPVEPGLRTDDALEPPTPAAGMTFVMDGKRYRIVQAHDTAVSIEDESGNRRMLAKLGSSWKKMMEALAEAKTPTLVERVKQRKAAKEWTAFEPESGTLGIPRADMPQIRSEHRGAMVNFLAARGITAEPTAEVDPSTLRPTQAEYSQAKVQKAIDYGNEDRSILVSGDGYVLDGHHQWLAKVQTGQMVKVIKLNAPIDQLLVEVKEFPSVEASDGATPAAPAQAPVPTPAAAPRDIPPPASPRVAARTEARGTAKHPATVMGSRLLARISMALDGLHPSLLSEFSHRVPTDRKDKNGFPTMQWRNPLIPGVGNLFRRSGTLDRSRIAGLLEDYGYLPPGSVEADYKEAGEKAKEMIKAALDRAEPLTKDEIVARAEATDEAERQAYYAEVDAEAARELEEEREAILAAEGMSVKELDALADDDLFDFQGSTDTEACMRAMGFSEQEIADELAQEAANRASQGSAEKAGQDGPADAGQPPAQRSAAPGPAGQEGAPEDLTLESYDAEILRNRIERQREAEAAARRTKEAEQERLGREAEQKDIRDRADRTVDDFQLGQSAEQQLSGMGDLFAQPPAAPEPPPAASPAPRPKPARDESVIHLRKQLSVLEALRKCLG